MKVTHEEKNVFIHFVFLIIIHKFLQFKIKATVVENKILNKTLQAFIWYKRKIWYKHKSLNDNRTFRK